jgi:hypothetical protein
MGLVHTPRVVIKTKFRSVEDPFIRNVHTKRALRDMMRAVVNHCLDRIKQSAKTTFLKKMYTVLNIRNIKGMYL